ncbi:HD-GYP domain-containing protein [Elstera litoralis]|uniref:HD-GYP domain-containing protein n=1 Tax=Elstera litoralis TaxID=552518 RepID=UPI000695FBBB|nr:HD domain-containing phosphohydrolase [Elstera litoralis]
MIDDPGLRQHSTNVGVLSSFLGHCAGTQDSGWLDRLAEAAILHDIGKTRLDPIVLRKGRDVTRADMDHIRSHGILGAELLETYGGDLYALAATVAGHHHEAHDGSGYPQGLIGEAIPEEARIVALCDVYDALRSPRTYKPAFGHDHAMRIILNGDTRTRPQQFDPYLLGLFKRHSDDIGALYRAE